MNEKENKEIRREINKALKEEFDELHKKIIDSITKINGDSDALCKMIRAQLEITQQIIREERALSGESGYLLPPHNLKP